MAVGMPEKKLTLNPAASHRSLHHDEEEEEVHPSIHTLVGIKKPKGEKKSVNQKGLKTRNFETTSARSRKSENLNKAASLYGTPKGGKLKGNQLKDVLRSFKSQKPRLSKFIKEASLEPSREDQASDQAHGQTAKEFLQVRKEMTAPLQLNLGSNRAEPPSDQHAWEQSAAESIIDNDIRIEEERKIQFERASSFRLGEKGDEISDLHSNFEGDSGVGLQDRSTRMGRHNQQSTFVHLQDQESSSESQEDAVKAKMPDAIHDMVSEDKVDDFPEIMGSPETSPQIMRPQSKSQMGVLEQPPLLGHPQQVQTISEVDEPVASPFLPAPGRHQEEETPKIEVEPPSPEDSPSPPVPMSVQPTRTSLASKMNLNMMKKLMQQDILIAMLQIVKGGPPDELVAKAYARSKMVLDVQQHLDNCVGNGSKVKDISLKEGFHVTALAKDSYYRNLQYSTLIGNGSLSNSGVGGASFLQMTRALLLLLALVVLVIFIPMQMLISSQYDQIYKFSENLDQTPPVASQVSVYGLLHPGAYGGRFLAEVEEVEPEPGSSEDGNSSSEATSEDQQEQQNQIQNTTSNSTGTEGNETAEALPVTNATNDTSSPTEEQPPIEANATEPTEPTESSEPTEHAAPEEPSTSPDTPTSSTTSDQAGSSNTSSEASQLPNDENDQKLQNTTSENPISNSTTDPTGTPQDTTEEAPAEDGSSNTPNATEEGTGEASPTEEPAEEASEEPSSSSGDQTSPPESSSGDEASSSSNSSSTEQQQPDEGQTTEVQPTEEQSAEEPSEPQSTEDQSSEEKPTDELPTEDQSTEDQSTEEQSTEEQPTEEPTDDQPIEEQPQAEQPSEEQPAEEPAEEQPAEEQTPEESPSPPEDTTTPETVTETTVDASSNNSSNDSGIPTSPEASSEPETPPSAETPSTDETSSQDSSSSSTSTDNEASSGDQDTDSSSDPASNESTTPEEPSSDETGEPESASSETSTSGSSDETSQEEPTTPSTDASIADTPGEATSGTTSDPEENTTSPSSDSIGTSQTGEVPAAPPTSGTGATSDPEPSSEASQPASAEDTTQPISETSSEPENASSTTSGTEPSSEATSSTQDSPSMNDSSSGTPTSSSDSSDSTTASTPEASTSVTPAPASEAVSEPVTEPTTESATETSAEASTVPATEPITLPASEPATEPTTEASTDAATEAAEAASNTTPASSSTPASVPEATPSSSETSSAEPSTTTPSSDPTSSDSSSSEPAPSPTDSTSLTGSTEESSTASDPTATATTPTSDETASTPEETGSTSDPSSSTSATTSTEDSSSTGSGDEASSSTSTTSASNSAAMSSSTGTESAAASSTTSTTDPSTTTPAAEAPAVSTTPETPATTIIDSSSASTPSIPEATTTDPTTSSSSTSATAETTTPSTSETSTSTAPEATSTSSPSSSSSPASSSATTTEPTTEPTTATTASSTSNSTAGSSRRLLSQTCTSKPSLLSSPPTPIERDLEDCQEQEGAFSSFIYLALALVFILLGVGFPIIKTAVLQFRLQGQSSWNTPSHYALATKFFKPEGTSVGPADITKQIKEHLLKEHGIEDIAYVIPMYDLAEYWVIHRKVENCRASLLEIGEKLDRGQVHADKPTEDKIMGLNKSLSEHEEQLERMSSIYESHFSFMKSQSVEAPLLLSSKKQENGTSIFEEKRSSLVMDGGQKEEAPFPLTFSGEVIVVFESKASVTKVLAKQAQFCLAFQNSVLKALHFVGIASYPSLGAFYECDEPHGFNFKATRKHPALIFFANAVLLALITVAAFLIFRGQAEKALDDATLAIEIGSTVVLLNFALNYLGDFLFGLLAFNQMEEFSASLTTFLTWAKFLSSSVAMTLAFTSVSTNQESVSSSDYLFIKEGFSTAVLAMVVAQALVIPCFAYLGSVFSNWFKKFFAMEVREAQTQVQVNEAFRPGVFRLDLRASELVSLVLSGVLLTAMVPGSLPLTFIGIFIHYRMVKHLYLRVCSAPEHQLRQILNSVFDTLAVAIGFSLLLIMVFFSSVDLGDSGDQSEKVDHQLPMLQIAAVAAFGLALVMNLAISQALEARTYSKFLALEASAGSVDEEKVGLMRSNSKYSQIYLTEFSHDYERSYPLTKGIALQRRKAALRAITQAQPARNPSRPQDSSNRLDLLGAAQFGENLEDEYMRLEEEILMTHLQSQFMSEPPKLKRMTSLTKMMELELAQIGTS